MLFEENMDINMLLNINDNKLLDDKLGLVKGNMFKDEYIPYKDYKEKMLVAKNPKDEIKLKLYEIYFAINDLNLYLDLNQDIEIFNTYKSYLNMLKNFKEEYESIYGPLEITCISSDYDWNKSNIDNDGGIKYV